MVKLPTFTKSGEEPVYSEIHTKPLLVSRDKGMTFDLPAFSGKWPTSGGGYPLAARVLHDGQVVALYRRQNPSAYVITLSEDGGKSHRELTPVPKDSLVQKTAALSAGFDVDQTRTHHNGRFYLAYPAIRAKQKVIMLARSDDRGLSWRNSVAVNVASDTSDNDLGYVSLAINSAGVVGLSWSDPMTQAHYFSYSTDGGDVFSIPKILSASHSGGVQRSISSHLQNYLQTMGTYEPDVPDSSMGGASAVGKGLSIRLINSDLGFVQMSSDPSGAFHPIWVERGSDGQISLRTRQVRVVSATIAGNLTRIKPFVNVTTRVLIDAISQEFDPATGEYRVGFTITNTSDSTFRGPLRLRVRRLTAGRNFHSAQLLNATNGLTGAGAILDLDAQVINGMLASGQSTRPYVACFRSQPQQSYENVWQRMRSGETPHPISVEFDVLTSELVSP